MQMFGIEGSIWLTMSKFDDSMLSNICFRIAANNADPDQTPHKVTSDQGLHYFIHI